MVSMDRHRLDAPPPYLSHTIRSSTTAGGRERNARKRVHLPTLIALFDSAASWHVRQDFALAGIVSSINIGVVNFQFWLRETVPDPSRSIARQRMD
jgi:hypothetical protein